MADKAKTDADTTAALPAQEPADTPAEEPVAHHSVNELAALERVRIHTGWAAAGGLVPVPGLDVAALVAIQLKMLSDLGDIYKIPFQRENAKRVIASLVGGVGSVAVAQLTGWAIKSIPFIGTIASAFWQPAVASAATWALGKVFIQHFESGGTFLDFEPEKVREHFRQEFEDARRTGTPQAEKTAA